VLVLRLGWAGLMGQECARMRVGSKQSKQTNSFVDKEERHTHSHTHRVVALPNALLPCLAVLLHESSIAG
jgi:hypothetical protein